MSTYSSPDGTTILSLEFPGKKIKTLLEDLGLPSNVDFREANFENKRLVFLAAFREFLKGKLSVEELSEISNHLKQLFDQESRTKEQEEYEQMIYEAADLGYYVRVIKDPEKSMFAAFLKGCADYFEKNKHFLENLPGQHSNPAFFENEISYNGPVLLPNTSELKEKIKQQGDS